MSKVIEQSKQELNLFIIEREGGFKKFIEIKYQHSSPVCIEKENAREVALAICPELETEIKSQEFEIKRLTKVYIESVDKNHRFQKEKIDFAVAVLKHIASIDTYDENEGGLKLTLVDGQFYWESDTDGEHPIEEEQLIELYQQTLLTNGKEVV